MSIVIPSRYEYTGKEFSGGMSRARQYLDKHLDRLVMIKEVTDAGAVLRIYDEIAALQRIRSKHVVEVYDIIVGSYASEIGIVEDYVDGPDLEEIAAKHEYDGAALLALLYQVADAISEVHDQDIIHRDISWRNIKRDPAGYLKLFDFGLARITQENSSTTGYVGTPGFSAPELYTSGRVFFSQAVDVFAFGSIAWVLFAGKLPDWVVSRSLGENQVLESYAVSGLAPAVVALVDSAMAIDPLQRPKARDIVNVLSRELLRDRHRATLFFGSKSLVLDAKVRAARVGSENSHHVVVEYTGYDFIIASCNGDTYFNNARCKTGQVVQGCGVITLGGPSLGWDRIFITMDISYPEVSIRGLDVS